MLSDQKIGLLAIRAINASGCKVIKNTAPFGTEVVPMVRHILDEYESAAISERDARIAELEQLRSEDHAHAIDLASEIERLTRELEEARRDAELLDYIQTNGATVEIIPGAPDFYPVHFRVGGRYRTANESIRAAIRAAIKEQT